MLLNRHRPFGERPRLGRADLPATPERFDKRVDDARRLYGVSTARGLDLRKQRARAAFGLDIAGVAQQAPDGVERVGILRADGGRSRHHEQDGQGDTEGHTACVSPTL